MRLSIADRKDPVKGPLCQRAIIVFRGKIIKDIVEADSDEGWIVRYRRDNYGHIMIKDGEAETQRFFGRTRIIDPLDIDLAGFYTK